MNVTDEIRPLYGKKKVNRESQMQRACVKWCRLQYPQSILYAIGNGGKRSKIEAAIMVGEGVTKGVPDLFLAEPKGEWAGLYIELKVLPNLPTTEQLAMMDRLVKKGYACQVAYDLDQFMFHVNEYMAL